MGGRGGVGGRKQRTAAMVCQEHKLPRRTRRGRRESERVIMQPGVGVSARGVCVCFSANVQGSLKMVVAKSLLHLENGKKKKKC